MDCTHERRTGLLCQELDPKLTDHQCCYCMDCGEPLNTHQAHAGTMYRIVDSPSDSLK